MKRKKKDRSSIEGNSKRQKERRPLNEGQGEERGKKAYLKYIGTAVIFILTFYLLFSYKGINLFLWS